MSTIRLAIAEDNGKFHYLATSLIETGHDVSVVVNTDNGNQLIELLAVIPADIILLDIGQQGVNQMETVKLVRSLYPDAKIIVNLSKSVQETAVGAMITQGVKCLMDDDSSPDKFFKAIRIVHEGGFYVTDHSAKILQRYFAKTNLTQLPVVSEAEKRLIKMITEGLTSKQIGEKIHKSHRTVDDMREKLYRKFDVTNKVELITVALKYGL